MAKAKLYTRKEMLTRLIELYASIGNDLLGEIWAPIKGTNFKYEVSTKGRIRRVPISAKEPGTKLYRIDERCGIRKLPKRGNHIILQGVAYNIKDLVDSAMLVALQAEVGPETQVKDVEATMSKSNRRGKPVRCIQTGAVYSSRKQAEKLLGLYEQAVQESMKNNRPVKGYTFEDVTNE